MLIYERIGKQEPVMAKLHGRATVSGEVGLATNKRKYTKDSTIFIGRPPSIIIT